MARPAGWREASVDVDVDRRDDALRTAGALVVYGALAGAARAHPALLELAWPAGGVAALWLLGSWGRPSRLVRDAGLLVGTTVLAYAAVGATSARGLAVGAMVLLASLVTVLVLRRLTPPTAAGRAPRLERPADLGAVLAASAASGLVQALVSPSVISAADGEHLPLVLWPWGLRGAVSTFVVLAVGLRLVAAADAALLRSRARGPRRAAAAGATGRAGRGAALEAAAVVTVLAAVHAAGALTEDVVLLGLTVLPLAVWAGLRLPTTWTAAIVLADATAVVLLSAHGLGPAQPLPTGLQATTTQVLVGVVTFVTLVLALHRDDLLRAGARERRARERAQEQADLLGGVLASAQEGVVVVDAAGRVLLDNEAARDLLGVPADASRRAQDDAFALLHVDGTPVPEDEMPLVRALRGARTTGAELLLRRSDGTARRVVVTAHPLPGPAGAHGAVATLHDVTREREAAQALAESERLCRRALDASPLGMLVLPLDERPRCVLRTNPALERLLARTDLPGEDVADVVDPTDLPLLTAELDALADGAPPRRVDVRLLGPGGRRLRASCTASVVRQGDGRREAVLLLEDLTARHEAERALAHAARHDPLTGAPNRRVLTERLDALVGGGARDGARVGVVYLDLDGFKDVNDAEGHAVGDAVLREAARRLDAVVRPGDTVARLGGDEFVVVCPDLSAEADLAAVAQRVVDALGAPYAPPARRHRVTASAGTALAAPGEDAAALLARADAAMYAAKRAGGDRWSDGAAPSDEALPAGTAVLAPAQPAG
ncbi:diguanylate cyclase [Pseudokineococcus sp. 5B2Z-1]|uniref:diguanylate cyclase domain-containing protein n=1 Tax=Pseudokineococcus sp. 5B2Z-1 TaxID=3132744 RepID=UPI003094F61D